MEKYYILYRTTCLVTGRYYLGAHVAKEINDGYLGSGKRLTRSVVKHGRENHVREIMELCASREELMSREAEVVTLELLSDPNCMNLRVGGRGGYSAEVSSKGGLAGNLSMRKISTSDPTYFLRKTEAARSNRLRYYAAGGKPEGCFSPNGQLEMSQRAKSARAKNKRQKTFARIKHQQGSSNSRYGTCWIVKDNQERSIPLTDLDSALQDGWQRGRCSRSQHVDAP